MYILQTRLYFFTFFVNGSYYLKNLFWSRGERGSLKSPKSPSEKSQIPSKTISWQWQDLFIQVSCSKKGLTLYGSKVHNSSLAALSFPMATTSSMKYCLKQKLHGTTNFSPAGAYLITEQSYSCNFLFCVVSPFKKTCYYAICDYFHQASQKSWAEKLRIWELGFKIFLSSSAMVPPPVCLKISTLGTSIWKLFFFCSNWCLFDFLFLFQVSSALS